MDIDRYNELAGKVKKALAKDQETLAELKVRQEAWKKANDELTAAQREFDDFVSVSKTIDSGRSLSDKHSEAAKASK